MFYVFYGNDRLRAQKRAQSVFDQFGDLRRVNFDDQVSDIGDVLSFATTHSLFSEKVLVKCDGLLENENFAKSIFSRLDDFAGSENVFVFLESGLKADCMKTLKKGASEIVEYKLLEKKSGFNIFELSDAFGLRDRKALWVLYTKALLSGKSGEEISGTLFWQIKTMLLVLNGSTSSINPFVISKAKLYAKNYYKKELEEIALKLIRNYHEARRGRYDFEVALERLILSL